MGMPSNPTTEISSGTRFPRSRSARSTPMAMTSLMAKMAVSSGQRSSRRRVAS